MYRLQKEHLAGSMFTFQSCRKLMGPNWPTLRKHMLGQRYPENNYHCEICSAEYDSSQFIEMHEVYEAEYNVSSRHFGVKVVALQFLCKYCHLAKHRDYLAHLTEVQYRDVMKHISSVNGISYNEAVDMPAISVPEIVIIGGQPGDRFYHNYTTRDVESYSMEFDVEISNSRLKHKISERLSKAMWLKTDECYEINGNWYVGPTIISTASKVKSTLPFHINKTKLRKHREAAGYTQKELAAILCVPYDTYHSWESKDRNPSLENFEKIKAVLNCSNQDLI